MRTTSSRDNWERLVAAVIKRDQIWQLCHQDSITTVDSDFTQRDISLRSEPSSPSQLPLSKDSVFEVRKYGSGTITQKLFSALLWRKKSKDYDLGKALVGIPEDHFGLENFSLRELQVATNKFSNILGRGAFSEVYKGRLADGSLVAVKRLREEANVMIWEELEISSIVAHRNVIGLRGFCIAGKERLLVYPYMANGSVASCLKERQESQPPLDWASRPRIALGVARGLAHLHHGCIRVIMHRNVNAANILLDKDFEPVVSDFTLAKFLDCNDDYGFPEYLFTLETDVYDYGIFLLQLITAQSPFPRLHNGDNMALRNWVMELYGERNFEAMVDRDLKGNFMEEEVEELLQIALLCTQSNPEVRPTMPEVVRMLEDGDGLARNWEVMMMLEDGDGLARNWEVMMMLEVVDGLGEKSEDDCYNMSPDRLSGPR